MKRVMQKITMNISVDREQLYKEGIAIGVKDKALNTLLRFSEIEIRISVDTKTGQVSSIKIV